MIDNTKFATLPISGDIPDISENKEFNLPDNNLPASPYLNTPIYVPSSKPQYTSVGLSSDEISNSLLLGKQRLSQDPFIKAQRTEVPEVAGYDLIKESPNFQKIGVFPGLDVEETYGTAESGWEKLSKGIFGAGELAIRQFTDQLFSWDDTTSIFTGNSPFKQAELDAENEWQNLGKKLARI